MVRDLVCVECNREGVLQVLKPKISGQNSCTLTEGFCKTVTNLKIIATIKSKETRSSILKGHIAS